MPDQCHANGAPAELLKFQGTLHNITEHCNTKTDKVRVSVPCGSYNTDIFSINNLNQTVFVLYTQCV